MEGTYAIPQSKTGIANNQDTIKIVASLNFLGDFANALFGGNAEVTSLISANQDPHFYEPGTQDLTAMSQADVILGLGSPEFDKWLTDYIVDSGDKSLQEKLEFAVDADQLEEFDPLTGVKNPHFWLDPNKAKLIVHGIADKFIQRDLIDDEQLDINLNTYLEKLDELNSEIEERKLVMEGTKVVVDHPSFFYFLKRLGIERVGAIEVKEGEEPSPQHVQDLIEIMKEEKVELIVASVIQAGDDVQELARSTGAKIAYLTPLPGIENALNYSTMISYNLDALANPAPPSSNPSLLSFPTMSFLIILPLFFLGFLKTRKREISR